MVHRSHRRAFTLVELLVVIAILGIMMGMLLPAIQQVRESARRTDCGTRLNQIGKAFTDHHDTVSHLPVGIVSDRYHLGNKRNFKKWKAGRTAWVSLLPFIQHDSLYDIAEEAWNLADPNQPPPAHLNVAVHAVPLYRCPSDGSERFLTKDGLRWTRSNFVLNFGTNTLMLQDTSSNPPTGDPNYNPNSDGAFRVDGFRKFRDFYGGKQNTVMASEIIAGQSDDFDNGNIADFRGVWAWPEAGSAAYTHKNVPNRLPVDATDTEGWDELLWQSGDQHCVNTRYLPCRQPSQNRLGDLYATARSRHVGGVNILVADERVVFVLDEIDPDVWRDWGSYEKTVPQVEN